MTGVSTAVVLAGGKGTRLASAFPDLAKPMVPVDGLPIAEHLVRTYAAQGVRRFIFTLGYRGNQLRVHFGDGSAWGVSVEYFEEREPLGTAGALAELQDELGAAPFWVFYADTLSSVDLSRMEAHHRANSADATLLVHPNDHPYDSDLVDAEPTGRVRAVYGKPHPADREVRNVVNAALYLLEPSMLREIPRGVASDFGRDLFPKWAASHRLYAYSTPEYIKDMGKPERRVQVEAALRQGKVEARNLRNRQRAVFLDRDGVINVDSDLIKHPDELVLVPGAAAAIHALNQSDLIAVVVTNQSVVARNLTDEAGVDRIHARMERLLADEAGAFVDAIYYCPHHPHGGFPEENPAYKIECSCRKPKPGMLLAAADRFNIDLSSSYLVGDSPRDIEAGQAAGVAATLRVRTGHGLKPSTAAPTVQVDDLSAAVAWILEREKSRTSQA
ncbi:MAG: D-glycero-beta-D-manno-heptose 1,7-bisphosphate 7-phosphatase [Cryomorphaceae bacterium]|nr:D-glycero-beta-D-manno-heptose 1,7-bisphosphate 7-phosphatase [Cryomorphaceae bacterium]